MIKSYNNLKSLFLKNKYSICIFIISFSILYGILIISFSYSSFPKGWDTPRYYSYVRSVNDEGFISLKQTDRPLTVLFLTGIYKLYNLFSSIEPTYYLLYCQLVSLTLFSISFYLFIYSLTNNIIISSLSLLLTVSSINTLRYQPLISQTFGLSLCLLSLYYFLKYHNNNKYLFASFLFIVMAYFADPWIFIYYISLFIISYLFYMIYNIIFEKKSHPINGIKTYLFLLLFCISLLIIWWMLWPITFFDLIKRFYQIFNNLFNISFEKTLYSNNIWINLESTTLKILGIIGLFYLTSIKNLFNRYLAFFWFILPTLGTTLMLLDDESWRFFILIPFSFYSSLFIYNLLIKFNKIKIILLIKSKSINIYAKNILYLFIILLVCFNVYQAFSWQNSNAIGPFIINEQYNTINDIKINYKNNYIVCIDPPTGAGVWAEGILSSQKNKILIYYGPYQDLLEGLPPKFLSNTYYNIKFPNIENYTIILPKNMYSINSIDEKILTLSPTNEFFTVLVNNSSLININKIHKFSGMNIGFIGWQSDKFVSILNKLGLDKLGVNYYNLGGGKSQLPDKETLLKLNLKTLVLLEWYDPPSQDINKIVTLQKNGVNIIAIFQDAKYLCDYNSIIFQHYFGVGFAGPYTTLNKNNTYIKRSYGSFYLSDSFLSYTMKGSIVTNFTTAYNLSFTTKETYSILSINEYNNTKNIIFGKLLNDMDIKEIDLFEKLLLWSLDYE